MNKRRTLRIKARKDLENWSKSIREKDRFCQICGKTKGLNAHHILSKQLYPEFKLEIWNGITLCRFHHKYSRMSPHQDAIGFASWLLIECPELFYNLIDKIRAKNAAMSFKSSHKTIEENT
jgi:hypothetical protein